MLRIALSSMITAAGIVAVHSAIDTTPYIHIGMLFFTGVLTGAFIMYVAAFGGESEVE